ncbi:MAG: hypothetical protein ACKOZW_07260 [Cyanobium sp.]
MSLDPRSRERLEALGRRLPQPLPAPIPKPAAAPRHPLEVEENPEQFFRELMAASPDGSVPHHHLERLRQLEGQRRPSTVESPPPPPGSRGRRRPAGSPGSPRGTETGDLYAAFAELLLEQDEED